MSPGTITTAGTKDKRGVTVQRIRAFKVTAERLAGLNPSLRGMQLGNFEYVANPLKLGMLAGNRFVVVLRCVYTLFRCSLMRPQ